MAKCMVRGGWNPLTNLRERIRSAVTQAPKFVYHILPITLVGWYVGMTRK